MRIRLLPCLAFSLLLMAALISCSTTTEKAKIAAIQGIVTLNDTESAATGWSQLATLVIQLPAEPDNLHPTNGTSGQRSELFSYLHRYLVKANGQVPDLVESLPAVAEDGRTYRYHLKPGIVWDNGQPLTAADVFFTCQVNMAPQTLNPALKPYWSNLKDVVLDSSDPLAFTLVMKEPHIQNISFLSSFPILQRSFYDPANLLARYRLDQLGTANALADLFVAFNNDEYGRSPNKINGLGDYALADWSPGVSILLKRKRMVSGAPEKLLFKFSRDESSVALDLKNQVYDVSTALSMTTFLQLASDPVVRSNYHCVLSPTYNYSYLCFNTQPDSSRQPLFKDRKVRSAIAHLIDVGRITRLLYQEYSPVAKRMFTNVSPYKSECDTSLAPVSFDLSLAKKQLADAGWTDRDGDGVLDNGSTSLRAELLYLNTSPDWKDMAGLIAQELAVAGIQLTPVAVDQKVFLDRARNHQFDLLLGSWGGTAAPEDYTQLWSTASWINHGSNYAGFGTSPTDSLIVRINHALNEQDRIRLSHQLQREIYEEQPYVFLYTSLRRNVLHKRWGHIWLFPDRPGMNAGEFRLIPHP